PIHFLSGKYDFLLRWYVPNLNRWPNRDPLGDVAFFRRAVDGKSFEEIGRLFNEALKSSYRFVGNNPISMFDPNGLEQIEIDMYTEIVTSLYLGTAGVKTTHAVTIDTDTRKIVSEYKEVGKTWRLNGTATLTATAS